MSLFVVLALGVSVLFAGCGMSQDLTSWLNSQKANGDEEKTVELITSCETNGVSLADFIELETNSDDTLVAAVKKKNIIGIPEAIKFSSHIVDETNKYGVVFFSVKTSKGEIHPSKVNITFRYADETLEFGDSYIIPKPFDRRLFVEVSYAVAEAAVKTGVAADGIDLAAYRASLEARNAVR